MPENVIVTAETEAGPADRHSRPVHSVLQWVRRERSVVPFPAVRDPRVANGAGLDESSRPEATRSDQEDEPAVQAYDQGDPQRSLYASWQLSFPATGNRMESLASNEVVQGSA